MLIFRLMKIEDISLGNFKEVSLGEDFKTKIDTIRKNKDKVVLVEFFACQGEYLCGMIDIPEDRNKTYFSLKPITKNPFNPLAISYGLVNRLFVNNGVLHHPH